MASKDKRFELIYSAQRTGFEAGRRYSNPRFFSTPRAGVSKVIVIGDYPNIVDAYKRMGIPVDVVKNPSDLPASARKTPAKVSDTPKAETRADAPSVTETAYLPTAEPREAQEAVDIPENWRELSWPQRKSLASRVTDMPIINGDDANAAIELELERRKGG